MITRRDAAAAAAGLAPFAVTWIAKVIARPRPFWVQYADPEMFFFYDGLRLLRGVPPANIDHPGTPMQILAAIVAAITGATPLVVDRYRVAMYAATALLTVSATLFLVRSRLLRELSLPLQIAALWTFWLAPAALRYISIASPEAIEFPFAALAAAAFVRFNNDRRTRNALLAGAAIGAAAGVKFVFLSWLLAAGFAVIVAAGNRRLTNAFAIGASAAGGFAIATCAAAARWPDMFRWVFSVLSRSRWYGEPAAAPPPRGESLHNVFVAVNAAKTWHLCLLVALALLVAAWWRNRELALIAVFCLTAVALNFAASAKGLVPSAAEGFGDIRYRYLLPSAVVAVIAIATAFRSAPPRAAQFGILIVAALAVAKAGVAEIRTHNQIIVKEVAERAAIDAAVAPLRQPGDVVVYAYAPEPSFALRFPTYDRRFMHLSVVAGDATITTRPAFNREFLGMIEKRYRCDGHFFGGIVSLPSGRTSWDLFVYRENNAEEAAAAPGTIVARGGGYVVVSR
jgi:hypothetical protein